MLKDGKNFREKPLTYFPYPVILVFNMTSRKKTLVCMCNDIHKTIQFGNNICTKFHED
jgi:hypothetical protein